MQLPELTLDLLNLLYIPLIVITAIQVKRGWQSLIDDDLTANDRSLIQRAVIFLLMPVVVLFHELGHCAAIWLFGGRVAEFHYAFLWGFVQPAGRFTQSELVLTYLAGNLVQVLIGMAALLGATLCTSPPAVALLVYFGLWSTAGTLIVYALLSFTGLYGDWINIYAAPLPWLTQPIALVHALLVIFILWAVYGTAPRIWFLERTRPRWRDERASLLSLVTANPGAAAWTDLGWCYFRVNLFGKASECLARALACRENLPETEMLGAATAAARGDTKGAIAGLTGLIERNDISFHLRVRALLTLASCQAKTGDRDAAFATYDKAITSCPQAADPHFFKAMLLLDEGEAESAAEELKLGLGLSWIDPDLPAVAARQLSSLAEEMSGKK